MRASKNVDAEIVDFLLDVPGIDVNTQDKVSFIMTQQQPVYLLAKNLSSALLG